MRRLEAACTDDTNTGDAFDPSIDYAGFVQDTFDGLGVHTAACAGKPADPILNEAVISHTGPDTNEFVEVFADASADYAALTVVSVAGSGNPGVVNVASPVGSADAGRVYVYRLEAGAHVQTRTMTVVK